MDSFDVLVIGGGIAGAAAALSAARTGSRVALVRRGPGATALAGGGWMQAPPAGLRSALMEAGLELVDCDGALPHPDGALVRCAVAAASHARASVSADAAASGRTIVCGIDGLASFHAMALAALWSDEADLPPDAFAAVQLRLEGTPAAGWSPASLAALLEREPQRLGSALARAARAHGAARVIVPAVLGLDDHARVCAAVQATAGVPVGEALGVAPSVPGWRMDLALLRILDAAAVRVFAGRAAVRDARDGVLRTVTLDDAAVTIAARSFVLASGKFLGGGITAESEFEESTLDCDVSIERFSRTLDDPAAALVFTDPVRTAPQAVLSVGVRADGTGRPLTPSDDVYLANVFVAGSVRAGVETAALGLGAAAHDGWDTGARAAAAARG